MQKGDLNAAQQCVLDNIRNLEAKGSVGFEEFARAVIVEFSTTRFHIVQSGPQAGSDVRSDPINLSRLDIECKRHTEKPPQLDALKSKLVAAASRDIPIDAWILVTTMEIDASKREKLHELGVNLGVGVCIVDSSGGPYLLCDLVVMAVHAPAVCEAFLGTDADLKNAIHEVTCHPNFYLSLRLLAELFQKSTLFYENACALCQKWLIDAQNSVSDAKSRLGGHFDLNSSNEVVIPRPNLLREIDTWYAESLSVLAVLGNEGMGKSWVVLDWVNSLLKNTECDVLPIFIPATKIEPDFESTIATAFFEMEFKTGQTSSSNQEFWKRRLTRWEKLSGNSITILLIIDGLNQNICFQDWATWLQPLFETHRCINYRVVVTCWPVWWNKNLSGLQSLEPNPYEIAVGGFEDAELNALLEHACIARSDLSQPVVELMKSPRMASLAIKHHQSLRASGDITAARLVYEDVKQTYATRRNHTDLSDKEFLDAIGMLGNNIKDKNEQRITRPEIDDFLLTRFGESGVSLKAAVNELCSGSWLQPSRKRNEFQVVEAKVPFAIGIALVPEISEQDFNTATAVINQFLDPLKSQSMGAQILFAALTFSLMDTEVGEAGKKAILYQLLHHQNFSELEFVELSRLVGEDTPLFLDFAESSWLDANSTHFLDEVLIKTFANSSEYPDVCQSLVDRITNWLSVVWTMTAEISEWQSNAETTDLVKIKFDDCSNWSWLCYRALQVLAYLPNSVLTKPLLAWSISRAIMLDKHHAEVIEWFLRWKSESSNEGYEYVKKVRHCLDSDANRVTRRASRYLTAVCSHAKKSHKPCMYQGLANENVRHPTSSIRGLTQVLKYLIHSNSWLKADTTVDIANSLNEQLSQTTVLSDRDFDLLLKNLETFLILLTELTRTRIYEEVEGRLNNESKDNEENADSYVRLKIAQHTLDLYSANRLKQSRLRLAAEIRLYSESPPRLDKFRNLYRPSTLAQSNSIELKSDSTRALVCWLDYLNLSRMSSDTSTLHVAKDLVLHDDLEVRVRSLTLAFDSNDQEAINVFLDSKFADVPPNQNSYDTFQFKSIDERVRSLSVLAKSNYKLDALLSKRIRHDAICEIVKKQPIDAKVLETFNKYLKAQFCRLETTKSFSSDTYIFDQTAAIKLLLRSEKSRVLEWLVPWINRNHAPTFLARVFTGGSPVIDMMQALTEFDSSTSLDMYEKLLPAREISLFSSSRFKFFPFNRHPVSDRCNKLREGILKQIKCDKEILDLCCFILENRDSDWLYNKIEEYLHSRSVWNIALGYTLLGYCDDSKETNQIWNQIELRPPLDKWLKHVFQSSLSAFSQNQRCRESFKKLWKTQHRSIVFRSLRIVEEFSDSRIKLWIEQLSPRKFNEFGDGFNYERLVACRYLVDRLNKDSSTRERKLKEHLFHTRIGPKLIPPWS